jgi:6-phosphogluconolactonase
VEDRLKPITVYIGTYTRRESFVDGKAEGIYVYRLDPATAVLTYAATVPGVVNPSFLAIGAQGNRAYAVNEITGDHGSHGTVSAFAIEPGTGNLTFLNKQSTHGLAPCYVSVDGTGRHVLVANYETGSLCVLPVQDDGRLGEATDVVELHGSGPNPQRQEGPHAHMILPGPGGRTLFAVDLGTDRIMLYRLDRGRGKLIPADPPSTQLAAGTGPRHLAFHPNGQVAYVIGELQSTVTVLHYDEGRSRLQHVQSVSTLPDDFEGQNLGAEMAVAPSGRFVYASNRGHDSIVIYEVDQATGKLSLVGHEPSQGAGPRFFTIDPTGTLLLVANQDSDTVVTFRIDQDTGELAATGRVTDVPTPVCLRLLRWRTESEQ